MISQTPQQPLLEMSSVYMRHLVNTIAGQTSISISVLFTRKSYNHSRFRPKSHETSEIPNGTYPIERLVDGAFGAFEDSPSPSRSGINLEPPLDFDSSWPLIYPQQLFLFQVDDVVHEKNTTLPRGFFNSKFRFYLTGGYTKLGSFP
jgi:hypothetical protein